MFQHLVPLQGAQHRRTTHSDSAFDIGNHKEYPEPAQDSQTRKEFVAAVVVGNIVAVAADIVVVVGTAVVADKHFESKQDDIGNSPDLDYPSFELYLDKDVDTDFGYPSTLASAEIPTAVVARCTADVHHS